MTSPLNAVGILDVPAPIPALRLSMIDIGKGIAILLIVFEHDPVLGHRSQELLKIVSGISLTFFFFIAGTTLSLGTASLKDIAIAKADALLKPFAVVVLLIGALNLARHASTVEHIVLSLIFGTSFTLSPQAVWFLPHLWLLNVLGIAFLRKYARLLDTPAARLTLVAALLTAGCYCLMLFQTPYQNPACFKVIEFAPFIFRCGLPFNADLTMITAAFLLSGYFLSNYVKKFNFHPLKFLVSLAALIFIERYFEGGHGLTYRIYDNPIPTTIFAFVGTYFILSISSLINKKAALRDLFSYIGRGSLFILLFHMPILYNLPALLSRWVVDADVVSAMALGSSVIVPLGIMEVCKRIKPLRVLFFPVFKIRKRDSAVVLAPGLAP